MCRWLAHGFFCPAVTKMSLKPEGVGFLKKAVAYDKSYNIWDRFHEKAYDIKFPVYAR